MKSKMKQSYNINEAKILIKNNYSYETLIMQTNKNTHTLSSQAHIRPTKNKERKHKRGHEKYKIKRSKSPSQIKDEKKSISIK